MAGAVLNGKLATSVARDGDAASARTSASTVNPSPSKTGGGLSWLSVVRATKGLGGYIGAVADIGVLDRTVLYVYTQLLNYVYTQLIVCTTTAVWAYSSNRELLPCPSWLAPNTPRLLMVWP